VVNNADFARPISLPRAALYASGNFGKNIVWSASELALIFVFTDLFGVPPALAGLVILLSLIWDALLDPLVGAFADRLGRFTPLIWAGAPLMGLSFVAMLGGPAAGLNGIAPACVALFALRTAYSLVDIPHNALIARLAAEPHQRTKLAGARFVFSAAATFVLGLTLPAIVALDSKQDAREALALWAMIAATGATVLLTAAVPVKTL
jgi:GPH family glycoside/pentoside/hexuronide:cation symporter